MVEMLVGLLDCELVVEKAVELVGVKVGLSVAYWAVPKVAQTVL